MTDPRVPTERADAEARAREWLRILEHDRAPFGTTTVHTRDAAKALRDLLAYVDAMREQLRMELDEGLTVDQIMTGPVKLSKIGGVNVKLIFEREEAKKRAVAAEARAARYEEALRTIVKSDDEPSPGYAASPDYYVGLYEQAEIARAVLSGSPEEEK